MKADCGDLAALPTLTFDFGGQHFDLEAKDYVLATDLHAGGAAGQVREAKKCVAGVTPLNLPNSGQQGLWVLGDLFLSKFFVSFDMDKRRVGLGRPRVGVPLQERVKKLAAISEKPMSESVESPESD